MQMLMHTTYLHFLFEVMYMRPKLIDIPVRYRPMSILSWHCYMDTESGTLIERERPCTRKLIFRGLNVHAVDDLLDNPK